MRLMWRRGTGWVTESLAGERTGQTERTGRTEQSGQVRRKRHILRWVALGVVIILGCGALGAYLKYRQVYDSIKRVPLTNLGKRPPHYSTSSMNILVYGSDSRAGLTPHQQAEFHAGHDKSQNTDTIMIVHISPGRHKVTVLSIPRDTMVPMYQCAAGPGYPGQHADPARYVMINSLLSAGGPSCLFKTVEQQTGIYLDHFIGLGMLGFVNVINDIGGVNVCVPFRVDDPVSGLNLRAGKDHITGVQALAFWRTREQLGTGSDLERIQRDQFMAAQVVKAVLGSDLLGNPLRLLRVVTDAAAQMTTDSGMSGPDLIGIADSLHSLNSKNVQFLTAPNQVYPYDPNRVEFAQPQADAVFSAIAHDKTVPRTSPARPVPAAGAQPLAASSHPAVSRFERTAPPSATPASAPSSASSSPSGIDRLAQANGGITGAAACASDASAFSGPASP